MAIYKGKIRQKKTDGTYDYLLPETTIDQVQGLQDRLSKGTIAPAAQIPTDLSDLSYITITDGTHPDTPGMATVDVLNDKVEGVTQQLAQTIGDVDEKVSQINNELTFKASYADVANLAKAEPLFVDNVSKMTDNTRTYVLTTTMYIYTYNSETSQFVNTNKLYQAVKLDNDSVIAKQLAPKLQNYLEIGFVWQQGGMDTSGNATTSTNRAKTNLTLLQSGTRIALNTNQWLYSYHKYNGNTHLSASPWISGETILDESLNYVILLKKVDDSVIVSLNDLHDVISVYDAKSVVYVTGERIVDGQVGLRKLSQDVQKLFWLELGWVVGGLSPTLQPQPTLLNRLSSNIFNVDMSPLDVEVADGYMYSLRTINKTTGEQVADSNWQTTKMTISNTDYNYRLMLRRVDNASINANIDDEVKNITVRSIDSILTQLDTLAKPITPNTLNAVVKAVMHRGFSALAPESTESAYRLCYEHKRAYVEADIRFTLDGEAVVIHDATIDRTSNGAGNVAGLTLAQLKSYDFGSWKSAEYAGEKILTLREFILLCKKWNLHPYIEMKDYSQAQVETAYSIVKKLGMAKRVTWIGGIEALTYIKNLDSKVRLAVVAGNLSDGTIDLIDGLQTGENVVVANATYTAINAETAEKVFNRDLELECYTVNDATLVPNLVELGVTGFTTDMLNISEILLSQ